MKIFDINSNYKLSSVSNFNDVIQKLNNMRDSDCNKGTFGTLACICGSYGMAGAAMLCGNSAVTTGAGIVKMIIPDCIYSICASQLWENVFVPITENTPQGTFSLSAKSRILAETESCTAAVIGCGMRVCDDTSKICDEIILKYKNCLVIDADGLNCISSHIDILSQRTTTTILTPHPKEMSRLCGKSVAEIQADRIGTAQEFAKKYRCIVVLKGVGTVITDGNTTFVNPTGNGCLAKGGSGDVLAGIIGSLVCQGIEPVSAAAAGVYIHGFAADECTDRMSMSCVNARDIINAVKYIM